MKEVMKEILKEALADIKITSDEKKAITSISKDVVEELNRRIKKKGIEASVFIGGSLAKDTIVKNKIFDVDIFVRFNPKYSEEAVNKLFRKIFFFFRVKGHKIKLVKMHGSRDYRRLIFKAHEGIEIEVIPVLAIKKPEEARNVTDMSYFHVNYVKSKLSKNKKLADDIILAKAFCHASKCYGAESYIKGFSGYALELLIIHYKGFENFLTELKNQNGKLIIDQEKMYKDHSEVIGKMNKSRLDSVIVLVDPTYKERNAAVSLSNETFNLFKRAANKFLENPSLEAFIQKKLDITSLRKKAHELEGIFLKLEVSTDKQAGDIAGTKLLKMYSLINRQIGDYFEVIGRAFEYHESINRAYFYYALNKKKERLIKGPKLIFKEAVENFKRVHPVWHIKNDEIYSAKPTDITPKHFVDEFTSRYKKTIREMGVTKIIIVED